MTAATHCNSISSHVVGLLDESTVALLSPEVVLSNEPKRMVRTRDGSCRSQVQEQCTSPCGSESSEILFAFIAALLLPCYLAAKAAYLLLHSPLESHTPLRPMDLLHHQPSHNQWHPITKFECARAWLRHIRSYCDMFSPTDQSLYPDGPELRS